MKKLKFDRNKKSQITIFIIIGLVLLTTIGITAYIKKIGEPRQEHTALYEISSNVEPVRTYVEECLDKSAAEVIKNISLHGGTIDPSLNSAGFQYYKGEKINYLCIYSEGSGCVNKILFREDIEEEISSEVNIKVKECVDLDIFRNQGFIVEAGVPETTTNIKDSAVSITLKYPLKLTKDKLNLQINTFSSTIKSGLGELFKTSINILNSELQESSFDSTEFMKNHADILVETSKPYPDIIFKISKKDISFQFAIKTKGTISDPLYNFYGSESYILENLGKLNKDLNKGSSNSGAEERGCCYNPSDNFCYQNSLKKECEQKAGIFSQACICPQLEYYQLLKLDPAKSCRKVYDRKENKYSEETKQNGESWCSYESLPGEKAEVGSRHYVHYCIDSKEYIEPCRDYREEVCVEENVEVEFNVISSFRETTHAVCRPNRWQDCSECESQECCIDSEVRDCVWKDMETEKKCVPAVTPGLKFWEMGLGALSVCSKANEKKECSCSKTELVSNTLSSSAESCFSCSQDWIDDSAKLCFMQADCGNNRNVKGTLTRYGYFNTDLKKRPDESIYDKDYDESENSNDNKNNKINNNNNNNNNEINDESTNEDNTDNANILNANILKSSILKFDAKAMAAQTPYTYKEAFNSQAELLSAGLGYLDDISSISAVDIINPFKKTSALRIMDVSLCSTWQPPKFKQDCGYCMRNVYRECSEYLCRSLGQQCVFDYNNGNPMCKRINYDDKTPPKIVLDQNAATPGYTIQKMQFDAGGTKVQGFRVSPVLKPYTEIRLGITADEPVTCKLALMPFKKFNELPGIYFGQHTFAKEHNVTLRVPQAVALPQNILDTLNITSYKELMEMIEQPEELVDNYKEKFSTPIGLYDTFSGNDAAEIMDPMAKKISSYIDQFKEQLPYFKAIFENSMQKIENKTYVVYLKCVDEAGNENKDPLFIEFSIEDNKFGSSAYEEDTTPASLIGTIPANNSIIGKDVYDLPLKLYLDEPATCKYDYDDKDYEEMQYPFTCEDDEYKTSSKYGGSYECTSTLYLPEDETLIFIKCKDNPYETKEYSFMLEGKKVSEDEGIDNAADVEELAPTPFLNVTDNNIYASLFVFEDEQIKFKVDTTSTVELHMFKDSLTPCAYVINEYSIDEEGKNSISTTNTAITGSLNSCTKTDKIYLGTYECVEVIMLKSVAGPTMQQQEAFANKTYNITIKCPTKAITKQNTNEQSFVFNIKKSEPLTIIDTWPDGEVNSTSAELGVKVNAGKSVGKDSSSESSNIENSDKSSNIGNSDKSSNIGNLNSIRCRYKHEYGLSYIDMTKEGKSDEDSITFIAQLNGLSGNLNSFTIKCTDEYGNSDEEDVEFYIIT